MVEGAVQGVGFRYFTWQKASELHIAGWVRNRMDGNVEIVAEGSETAIERFTAAIKKGSPFSHVENVDVYVYDHSKHFTTFDVVSSL